MFGSSRGAPACGFVRKSEEHEVLKEEQMNATEAARGVGREWVVGGVVSGKEGGSLHPAGSQKIQT